MEAPEQQQEESDILIDIPELEGLSIAPGQELKLMVRVWRAAHAHSGV
jgi:hypothetical protein